MEFWNNYSSARYSFPRNMVVGLYIYHISDNFRGLVKYIENKNQSARSNFAALKSRVMLSVSLTKTEQNTLGVLSSVPQNYAKMNKIREG